MRRTAFLLVFTLALTGCAGRHNKQMTKTMESWMGHDIKEVVDSWGPPSTVYEESPELKVYAWQKTKSTTLPARVHTIDYGSGVKRQTTHPGPTITRNYYRMFWVNPSGVIVKWKFGTQ